MAFELLCKKTSGRRLPQKSIALSKSTALLSRDLSEYFKGFNKVEIYVNHEDLKIGLKPSNDSVKGFALSKEKSDEIVRFNVGFLQQNVAKGIYPITIDDDKMLVFPVKEIAK